MRLPDGASDREDRGALVGTRTRDLILTKNVLCQLSYKGLTAGGAAAPGMHITQGAKGTAMRTPRDTELYRALPRASRYLWLLGCALARRGAGARARAKVGLFCCF